MDTQLLLQTILQSATGHARYIVAIAGPPGSGKTTLSQELALQLPPGAVSVVPMDGFHYDNAILHQLGLRTRKGAPETFDFAGFANILQRLRAREPLVAAPVFDRPADLARAAAALIPANVKYILVEGNYLLLDRPPWNGLAGCFDLTVFLDVPRPELRRRLLQRWLDLGDPLEKAEHWVESNDMLNVDLVLSSRRPEDVRL